MTNQSTKIATNDGFANFVARLGVGSDNLLSRGDYVFDLLTRNRIKLEAMYRGSWIVGKAVDTIAKDMTRAGVTITGTMPPDRIEAQQKNLTKLGVWNSLCEGIQWGRLYGGAISEIVIEGQDPESPLDLDTIGKGQFKGLRVYDRWQIRPELRDLVPYGRQAGTPEYYNLVSDVATGQVSDVRIHHSRIIRHIGIQLPIWQAQMEEWWGESVVERIYSQILSFDTATAGAANLLSKAYLRTVMIKGLREIFAAGDEAEENLVKMFEYLAIFQGEHGVSLFDSEDEFSTHQYSFGGISDVLLQFAQQVSAATTIPLVVLFGQSPAGLNATGEGDTRMYYDGINSSQEFDLREGFYVALQCNYRSLYGEAPPDDFNFNFNPLWQQTQKEKTEISYIGTKTIVEAYAAGLISKPVALKELKALSPESGMWASITDEDIEAAELEPPLPTDIEGIELGGSFSGLTGANPGGGESEGGIELGGSSIKVPSFKDSIDRYWRDLVS